MRYDWEADLIALSVATHTADCSCEIADQLRAQRYASVAGGIIHPSVFPQEAS